MAETCSPSVAISYDHRSTSNLHACKEEIFRKGALFFLWVLVFVIPWERAAVIDGFGTISRVVGIPAFGMALLAILECGTLRVLATQQIIMLAFFVWGGFTYFWSFDPSATLTSINTFVQLFMMVWLIWEFAQTRKEQLLLLRAYVLGSIISSVSTVLGFFNNTGLQSGRYSMLSLNPGGLAFVLGIAIPISLYLAVQESSKILIWIDGAASVLAFCAIVFTGSRGSLVACLPTLLLFPFFFHRLRWGRNLLIFLFVVLAGIGAWLFMPESSWSLLSATGTDITPGALNERTIGLQPDWQLVGQAALRGFGAGAYAPAAEHTLGLANSGSEVAPLVAHNTFFSVLREEGLIGFALLFLLLVALAVSAWRLPRVDRIFWLSILLTWAIGSLGVTWEQKKPTWLIFGLLSTVAATQVAPESRLFGRRARPEQQSYPQTTALAAEIPSSQGRS